MDGRGASAAPVVPRIFFKGQGRNPTCMIAAVRAVVLSVLILSAAGLPVAGDAQAFGLDDVSAQAAKLAAAPYRKPNTTMPAVMKALDYDQFRDIRFRPERAMWRNIKLPFE